MVRVTLSVLLLALSSGAIAHAADQPLYGPPPSWVRSLPVPSNAKASGAAVDVVLWTSQSRLNAGVTETFVETASRINSPEGLGDLGSLTEEWDPSTESLTIHRARILRAGKVIDLLANGAKFTVLRRETNLEAAAIDGALTVTLQPEGLQVGDVLDFAVTRAQREPVLADHAEVATSLEHPGSIGRLFVSVAWPSKLPMRLWKTDDIPALTPITRDGWTRLEIDETNAVSPDAPSDAPSYDQMVGMLQASDFSSWKAVSAADYPVFARAATLKPDSPLLSEIAQIKAMSPDPKARALAALKLVESQTRYLYVGLDAGGFTPAPADLTWTRRFGDCKGKSVLLLALLQGLGIKAEAVLVDTSDGEALDRINPRFEAFDHVIVRAEIDGQSYWLDGTRLGDEDLDILPVPNYYWALPLRAAGADLVPLVPKVPALPLTEIVEQIDARAGIDKPALVHEEIILRGDNALSFSLGMKQASRLDAEKGLKILLTARRAWIKSDSVSFKYDPLKMEARATLEGAGVLPFTSATGATIGPRDWYADAASIGSVVDFTRIGDYHRDAPFTVQYPTYSRTQVEVQLPDGGKNFEVINGESVDRTVGGKTYTRAAAIANGRLRMFASTRAIAPTFPASQATSTQAALRDMASYSVSLHYDPSLKSDESAIAKTAAATTPPDISRTPVENAEAAFVGKDYARAESGFSVALAETPTAKLYYDRAAARAALGKDVLAEADLQAAIKLDPNDSYALFALGRFELRRRDLNGAAKYFAEAEKFSPQSAWMAEKIAQAYESAGFYPQAFSYRDQIVSAMSTPGPRARALNGSCWSRARAGLELDRALKDCDASLQLQPDAPDTLDSRGLAHLRAGAPDKALVDYDAALARRPDAPTSLYGRALAEAKLGQSEKAAADLAQARMVNPTIDTLFGQWGVKP